MLRESKALGFTLLELMAAIAILAIVVGIAAPSFVTLIENNRIQTQANTFHTSETDRLSCTGCTLTRSLNVWT